MEKRAKKHIRKRRLLEMEQWDRDFIDLTGEANITIEKKNRGELQLGADECSLDCRIEKAGERERMNSPFWAMMKAMRSPEGVGCVER